MAISRTLPPARLFLVLLAFLVGGCRSTLGYFAMPFLYDEVPIAEERVVRDLPYRSGPSADDEKHRLDLFLPETRTESGWPVVVFVHGGGWTSGDRRLRFGGADVYANIGRYLASHGIGTAVISYRLQFEFDWTHQVEDVAHAVSWVQSHVRDFGGNPNAVFLMGHSAGAQLAAFVAFDPDGVARPGAAAVCGVIPVSGAGYDLQDQETYERGARLGYYERRFRVSDEDWQREASVVHRIGAEAPPALVLYAEDDWPALRHQASLLERALSEAKVPVRLQRIAGEDHFTIVLALTDDGGAAGPSIVEFVRSTTCES